MLATVLVAKISKIQVFTKALLEELRYVSELLEDTYKKLGEYLFNYFLLCFKVLKLHLFFIMISAHLTLYLD